MVHVALCGDSIFDNRAYIDFGEPEVVEQVRAELGPDATATLLAVDGSVTSDLPTQLARLPADTTHIVISSGGNDALAHIGVLDTPARSFADALAAFAEIGAAFADVYDSSLASACRPGIPVAVCLIYEPRFVDSRGSRMEELGIGDLGSEREAELQKLAVSALTHFNDVIARTAYRRGIPLIDLREVCNEDRDFANPIEPSCQGGAKIAKRIRQVVREHDFTRGRCEVYV